RPRVVARTAAFTRPRRGRTNMSTSGRQGAPNVPAPPRCATSRCVTRTSIYISVEIAVKALSCADQMVFLATDLRPPRGGTDDRLLRLAADARSAGGHPGGGCDF